MSVNQKNSNSAGDFNATTAPLSATPGETSLVDTVYQRILLGIIRGKFVSGQELKSTLLAQNLGVSRTPVVQALHRLAADGIVTLEMNKRAVVREGAENWLVEIHQLRELLEPQAAALAASRIPEAELQQLGEKARLASDVKQPNWSAAAQAFDFALHLTIADNTGNQALREAIRKCWSYKQLSYSAVEEQRENLLKAYDEHIAIYRALQTRDPETAEAAMRFHLRSAAVLRPERRIV